MVLASGSGTLLQALLDTTALDSTQPVDPQLPARVVAVGSDVPGCAALGRAERAGVATFVRPLQRPRADWDEALADDVAAHRPDLVVLAGFMRLVGPAFLARFGGRTLNSHPALSPSFPGTAGPADALAYGVKVTGCTLFLVDAGVDTGLICAQRAIEVADDDTVETLHERIKIAERAMLVDTVARMVRSGWTLNDRRVVLG